MTYTAKRWIRLGLGAALLGTAGLSACGGEGGETGETAIASPAGAAQSGDMAGEMGEGEGGEGAVAPLDPALLVPVDQRAAMIASEAAVGAALSRAGERDAAAEHFRLAISEIKPGGLSRLVEKGLDPDLFDAAAEALEDGAGPLETETAVAAKSLEDVRQAFSAMSAPLAGAIKRFGGNDTELYLQHCPMAFNNAGGDWLSDVEAVRNPYFGDRMLKCGRVMETIK